MFWALESSAAKRTTRQRCLHLPVLSSTSQLASAQYLCDGQLQVATDEIGSDRPVTWWTSRAYELPDLIRNGPRDRVGCITQFHVGKLQALSPKQSTNL